MYKIIRIIDNEESGIAMISDDKEKVYNYNKWLEKNHLNKNSEKNRKYLITYLNN